MTHSEAILAVDVGTQSTRALAFTGDGRLLDYAQIVYPTPYLSPLPGWAEQVPELYWDWMTEATQKLWRQGRVRPESIAALTLTTQRSTIVLLDELGQPLRPAIVWLDQRRASRVLSLGPFWETTFKLAGLKPTLRHLQAEAEINWLAEQEPDVLARTKHYLLLSGYLHYRLTGQYVDTVANQVGYIPFDVRRQTWSKPNSWKARIFPVEQKSLPKLVASGSTLGELTAKAAAQLGLRLGLSVIGAASDKACEVLGSGCLEPHQGSVGYGTTATFIVNSNRYVEPVSLVPPYPSAQPGAYNLEMQTYRGFWMVSWFKEQFAQEEMRLAGDRGISAEQILEQRAAEIPPGSLGLMLQPFWSPGVRYPGPEAKGAMIGFGGIHTKNHVYRAILEGLAYAIRDGKERIEKKSGIKVQEIYVSGGGSQSRLVMQITANVLGLPAFKPSTEQTSGLGAAILAANELGWYQDLPTAVQNMTHKTEVFEPQMPDVALYDSLYRQVYQNMYPKLRPLFRAIQEITGYPSHSLSTLRRL
ncbi:carbohydrate kinase [Alicyclobacillaceae bacterium I2511]|nr:carbohydrate kinase [Alicyclobacillaceae bacterium I2511]